jgi:hypothetical protein
MLERVILRGFKRHHRRTPLPLAPVTLLLGGNSAGKSSVFQAILALKQSFEGSPNAFHRLRAEGRHTQLGSFGNVQNHRPFSRGEPAAGVTIGLHGTGWKAEYEYENPAPILDPSTAQLNDTNELWWMNLETVYCRAEQKKGSLNLQTEDGQPVTSVSWAKVERRVGPGNDAAAWQTAWCFETAEAKAAEAAQEAQEAQEAEKTIIVPEPVRPPVTTWRADGTVATLPSQHANLGADGAARELDLLRGSLGAHIAAERALEGVHHIGPTRKPGQRFYAIGAHPYDEVGPDGHNLASQVSATSDGYTINEMLKSLDIDYRLATYPLNTITPTVDLRLRDLRGVQPGAPPDSAPTVGISDVGFGISQLLPILGAWAGVLRRAGESTPQTLLIEQPELHLHPRLQVGLMELLSSQAALRRSARKRRAESPDAPAPEGAATAEHVQVIIETHSEIVVRAMMQRVRRKELRPEDVCILAFSESEDRSEPKIYRIRLTETGEFLDPWPDGFFEERFKLMQ